MERFDCHDRFNPQTTSHPVSDSGETGGEPHMLATRTDSDDPAVEGRQCC